MAEQRLLKPTVESSILSRDAKKVFMLKKILIILSLCLLFSSWTFAAEVPPPTNIIVQCITTNDQGEEILIECPKAPPTEIN